MFAETTEMALFSQTAEKRQNICLSLSDISEMVAYPNKENANIPHGPEATNLTLAETIKKEYALLSVFPSEVSEAHAKGDIHIHDLGFIDRSYCSGQSLEYV